MDILITEDNSKTISTIIHKLHQAFNLKELCLISSFLGIQITKIASTLLSNNQTSQTSTYGNVYL